MARHAVILVHGMGEQIPMETLKGFVDAVWTTDASLVSKAKPDPVTGASPRTATHNRSWSKPDELSDSFELRRITTESTDNRTKVDFFEFYWAHHMANNKWGDVIPWVWNLLVRKPSQVPAPVKNVWTLLWAVALIALGVMIYGAYQQAFGVTKIGWGVFWLGLLGTVISIIGNALVLTRFGDVARYVMARPNNVATRQKIRQQGVEFFDKVLRAKDDKGRPRFDRVSVVAHSLGTIVAYDILNQTFGRVHDTIDRAGLQANPAQPARDALEAYLQGAHVETNPETAFDPNVLRRLIDAAREENLAQGGLWRITDFISLGSPLTHAEFLMARDSDDLGRDMDRRVFPTCPPVLEYDMTSKDWRSFYRPGIKPNSGVNSPTGDPRVPHHGALFAFTNWTNIYSPVQGIVKGDLISGPVRWIFGSRTPTTRMLGATDISVLPPVDETGKVASGHTRKFVTHNNYWSLKRSHATERSLGKNDVPYHIKALRDALRIDEV